MLIVNLAGGLGNQIFQLGAAILLAQSSGIKNIVIDDSSLGNYQAKRSNELLKLFDFSRSSIDIEFSKSSITKSRLPKLLPVKLKFWPLVSDKNFQVILKCKKPQFRYLDGYFQSCLTQQNFDEMRELLSKMFISNPVVYDSCVCVIHIRGGDFVQLGWDIVTPPSYYHHAIKIMSQSHAINKFLVVTDDVKYASNIMDLPNVSYQIISDDIISDFNTIAYCQKKILSNSTFSLWASALGQINDVVIIAPKFFKPGSTRPFSLTGEIQF